MEKALDSKVRLEQQMETTFAEMFSAIETL